MKSKNVKILTVIYTSVRRILQYDFLCAPHVPSHSSHKSYRSYSAPWPVWRSNDTHQGDAFVRVTLDTDSKTVTARAAAEVKGPGVNGHAKFIEYDVDGWKYVHLHLELEGDPKALPAGKHAVHIHEKAACDCEGFKCAGGHFDPGPSGNTDPDANHGYHAGDLPSITIDKSGRGELEAISSRITLSPGPTSIIDVASAPDGTSIMIHGNPDPFTSGKSGSGHSGGPRLACGTIRLDDTNVSSE